MRVRPTRFEKKGESMAISATKVRIGTPYASWGERTSGNHDLAEVHERIRRYVEEFARDGTRITGNLDFA